MALRYRQRTRNSRFPPYRPVGRHCRQSRHAEKNLTDRLVCQPMILLNGNIIDVVFNIFFFFLIFFYRARVLGSNKPRLESLQQGPSTIARQPGTGKTALRPEPDRTPCGQSPGECTRRPPGLKIEIYSIADNIRNNRIQQVFFFLILARKNGHGIKNSFLYDSEIRKKKKKVFLSSTYRGLMNEGAR